MRWVVIGVVAVFALPILMLAPMLGILVSPWAPWWLSGQVGQIAVGEPVAAVPFDPSIIPVVRGGVTDAFRYQLARAAGWSREDAITAVAISIAEDGSGEPTARCFNCIPGFHEDSRGLWMINVFAHPDLSAWDLYDPAINAQAAHRIFAGAGWCAWSTYESSCGLNHTSSYRAYLGRARVAADVQPLPGEA